MFYHLPRYLIEFVPYTYFVANKKMVSNTYIVNAHFITTFIVLTRKSLPRTFNVTFVFSKCHDTLQWIFGGPNDTHIPYSKRFIMHTYVSFPGRLFLINRRKIDSKYIHFVASTLYIWDKFLL